MLKVNTVNKEAVKLKRKRSIRSTKKLSKRSCEWPKALEASAFLNSDSSIRVAHKALLLLNESESTSLVCRETEFSEVCEHLSSSIESNSPFSFFLSGRPGTGKTALVEVLLKSLSTKFKFLHFVNVNCLEVSDSVNFLQAILSGCGVKKQISLIDVEGLLDKIKKHFCNKRKKEKKEITLLILDEVDQLYSKELLYKLYELPFLTASTLFLLTIANAHDLIVRTLPRLEKEGCAPKVLNFSQYTCEELVAIVKHRLRRSACYYSISDYEQSLHRNGLIFEESALHYIAQRVSGVDGDVRKALDLSRQAIERAKGDYENNSLA
jgi:Cdc6-like AAA superfamily ATPase